MELKDRFVSLLKMGAVAFIAIFANDTAFISDFFGSVGLGAIPALTAVVVEGLAWAVEKIKGA